MSVTLNVIFEIQGNLIATLFRSGSEIEEHERTSSGNLIFSKAQSGDSISANGHCQGKSTITINHETSPTTPASYSAGPIIGSFDLV